MSVKEALRLKNEANVCFKEKRYFKAIELYTKSLEQSKDILVFGNRAQAFINLKKWDLALMDCNLALQMDAKYAKGLYRRAVALDALELHEAAVRDLDRLSALNGDAAAKSLKEKIGKKLNSPLVSLRAVSKGDELRSDDTLMDVEIEVIGEPQQPSSSVPDISSVSLTHSQSAHQTLSIELPKTFTDFECVHRRLGIQPERFAEFFLSIPSSRFPFLFSNLFESHHLRTVLIGLNQLIVRNTSVSLPDVFTSLHALTRLPSFDLLTMFMEEDEKQALREICDRLSVDYKLQLEDGFGII